MSVIKEFASGAYTVTEVTWSPYISLIPSIGIGQLQIYYKSAGAADSAYVLITKNSYKDTFNSSSNTVDLSNATYNNGSNEVVIGLNSSTHDIKLVRETSASSLYITFQEGAKLSAADLNTVNLQFLHRIEEERYYSNQEDDDLRAYVDQLHALQYLKTEIDEFFRTLTVPNWVSGKEYVVGDTVLHDDPNTEASTLLVWYAGIGHESNSGNQPSESAPGNEYWTVVNPQNSLDNLSYIRKIPGAPDTSLNWNTIETQNANAYGLVIKPGNDVTQAVDLFRMYNNSGLAISYSPHNDRFTFRGNTELRTLGDLNAAGSTFLSNAVNKTTYVGWHNFTGSLGGGDTPSMLIHPQDNDDALRIYNSSSQEAVKVDDDGLLTVSKKLSQESRATFTDEIYIDGPDGPIGTHLYIGTDWPIYANRDVQIGKTTGGVWDSKCTVSYTTGNVTTDGNISCADVTSSGDVVATSTNAVVHGYDVKVENVKNASVIGTDGNGKIIDAGSTPSLNKLVYTVTANPGSALSLGDVVYLNRDGSTYTWTKSIATDPAKLAVGIVDSVSANGGNQDINVLFAGACSQFTGLSIGDWYFLSKTTAGAVTNTRPEGLNDLVDPIGIAVAADTIFVVPARPNKITA